jgi:hypothetical protein
MTKNKIINPCEIATNRIDLKLVALMDNDEVLKNKI